jgi:hypothetical protein
MLFLFFAPFPAFPFEARNGSERNGSAAFDFDSLVVDFLGTLDGAVVTRYKLELSRLETHGMVSGEHYDKKNAPSVAAFPLGAPSAGSTE